MALDDALKRQILRDNIERESAKGRGVRSHEIDKTVAIAESLFHGQKTNGEASREAIALVREGKA